MTTLSLAIKESAQERDLINVTVMESASFKSVHHLTALNDEMQSFRKPGFGAISVHRSPC